MEHNLSSMSPVELRESNQYWWTTIKTNTNLREWQWTLFWRHSMLTTWLIKIILQRISSNYEAKFWALLIGLLCKMFWIHRSSSLIASRSSKRLLKVSTLRSHSRQFTVRSFWTPSKDLKSFVNTLWTNSDRISTDLAKSSQKHHNKEEKESLAVNHLQRSSKRLLRR